MTIFSAYIKGLKTTFRHWKLWLFLFLINLLFAFLAAGPFSDLTESELAHSAVINDILGGFDYTVFMEFYLKNKGQIWSMIGQAIMLVFVFFALNIFFSGGIVSTFFENSQRFTFRNFWHECSRFFWRFLRLTVYFLIFHAVLFAVFGFIYFTLIEGGSNANLVSEVTIISMAKIILPIYGIFAIVLSMIQDYAKIHLVAGDQNILTKPILETFKLVFRNFGITFSLYLLNIATLALIFGIYRLFQNGISDNNLTGILLMFLVSQFFILGRIGVKLLNLSSAIFLYKNFENQEVEEV